MVIYGGGSERRTWPVMSARVSAVHRASAGTAAEAYDAAGSVAKASASYSAALSCVAGTEYNEN